VARAKARTVYINGQRWKIRWARLRTICGDCDYATKTIRIDSRLKGVELMDTLIHEIIHARWPDLHEGAVLEVSTLLAHELQAAGFLHREE
jgi:hypothetical protein